MISASKSNLNLNNLKILRPKVTKILQIYLRSFVNSHPGIYCDTKISKEMQVLNRVDVGEGGWN